MVFPQQVRDLVEETARQLKNYEHDTEHIKLQLKDKMHDVEKVLQQGKLVTMGEVKSEIKERYKVSARLRNMAMLWLGPAKAMEAIGRSQ